MIKRILAVIGIIFAVAIIMLSFTAAVLWHEPVKGEQAWVEWEGAYGYLRDSE